jgi:hypothetical protein
MAPLALIAEASLRARDGTTLLAKQLWEKQPAFIYILRRPGACWPQRRAAAPPGGGRKMGGQGAGVWLPLG